MFSKCAEECDESYDEILFTDIKQAKVMRAAIKNQDHSALIKVLADPNFGSKWNNKGVIGCYDLLDPAIVNNDLKTIKIFLNTIHKRQVGFYGIFGHCDEWMVYCEAKGFREMYDLLYPSSYRDLPENLDEAQKIHRQRMENQKIQF